MAVITNDVRLPETHHSPLFCFCMVGDSISVLQRFGVFVVV